MSAPIAPGYAPAWWTRTDVVAQCAAPPDMYALETVTGQPRRIHPETVSVRLFHRTGEYPLRSLVVTVAGRAALTGGGVGTRRGQVSYPDVRLAPAWVRTVAEPMIELLTKTEPPEVPS